METQDRKHSAFLHEGRIIRLIRDLKIRRRRWQRELQKNNRINNQKNNFARASRFFAHFIAVTARLRRENALFHDSQTEGPSDDEISPFFELGYGS